MLKTCYRCRLELDISLFGLDKCKKDGLRYICKTCAKKERQDNPSRFHGYQHKRFYKLKDEYLKLKEQKGGCILCGESTLICLDFHHIEDKVECVSRLRKNKNGWQRIIDEMNKCELLCANCHRKLHGKLVELIPSRVKKCISTHTAN
jgi:hypothetical protein